MCGVVWRTGDCLVFCAIICSLRIFRLNEAFRINRRLIVVLGFLLVSYAASDVVVFRSGQSITIAKGQVYTIRCTVTGNDTFEKWSNPSYTSSINNDSNIRYNNSDDEHDLEIVNMSAFIAGTWTCYSKEGNTDFIMLEFAPSIVTPTELQQTLVKDTLGAIHVDIRGYPSPDYVWKKDGTILTIAGRYSVADNGTLLISKVELSDAGTYSIRGSKNTFHADSGDIAVTVQDPPSFIKDTETIHARLNSDAKITCIASGMPAPDIKLSHSGKDIGATVNKSSNRTSLTYTIDNVMVGNLGVYICTASNTLSSVQKNVTLQARPGSRKKELVAVIVIVVVLAFVALIVLFLICIRRGAVHFGIARNGREDDGLPFIWIKNNIDGMPEEGTMLKEIDEGG